MDKQRKDIMILSATLFSMFFGAGNLIFPPSLGFIFGEKWYIAFLGFFLTGTGLPLLGIIASAKSDGDMDKLGERVSKPFSKFLGIVIVLSIGPLMAIPRTGATSYEMAIQPIWNDFNPGIFAFIYFTSAYLLVRKPTKIVDRVGKILTPALVILLILIIIFGILNPMGSIINTKIDSSFVEGFQGGYQTMDAFAALLFGGIIINSVKDRGYSDKDTQINMTLKSGLIATIGLTIIYGGLSYLGATASGVLKEPITKVELIMAIAENSLGSFGKIGLAMVVTLACLTTTIGLISTVGNYFEKLTNGKLKYKEIIVLTTIFSGVLSVVGVDQIIKLSFPILFFMYPIVIVLIFMTIVFDRKVDSIVYKYPIFITIIISILATLKEFKIIESTSHILKYLPLYNQGFPWLVPAMIFGLIGYYVSKSN